MMWNYQSRNLQCTGRASMAVTYKKLLRTGVFLVALGAVTIVAIEANADWQLLVPYVIGILILFGVEGFEISYGNFTFRFPIDTTDDHSQTDMSTDKQE